MNDRGRLAPFLAAALSIALPLTIGCLPPDSSGSLGTAGAPASVGTGGHAGTGGTTGGTGAAGTMPPPTGRGGSVATTGTGGGGIAGTTGGAAGSRGGAGDGPGGHGGGGATGLGGVGGTGGHAGMAGVGGRAGAGGGAGGGTGGAAVPPTFTQIYKSILMVYCQGSECHNPGNQRNVSFATQAKAYTSARALITAGSADRSTFYNEVYTGAMPPIGDALSESQIKMIADWINAGAMNN